MKCSQVAAFAPVSGLPMNWRQCTLSNYALNVLYTFFDFVVWQPAFTAVPCALLLSCQHCMQNSENLNTERHKTESLVLKRLKLFNHSNLASSFNETTWIILCSSSCSSPVYFNLGGFALVVPVWTSSPLCHSAVKHEDYLGHLIAIVLKAASYCSCKSACSCCYKDNRRVVFFETIKKVTKKDPMETCNYWSRSWKNSLKYTTTIAN